MKTPSRSRTSQAASSTRREPSRPSVRGRRAQGERVNLSFRLTPPAWERVHQLALSDRVSVQELLHAALSREFERRGLAPLEV